MTDQLRSEPIPVATAVAVVVATAPMGYLVGWLFTVHLVPGETTAVWLTTVASGVLGLLVAARLRGSDDRTGL